MKTQAILRKNNYLEKLEKSMQKSLMTSGMRWTVMQLLIYTWHIQIGIKQYGRGKDSKGYLAYSHKTVRGQVIKQQDLLENETPYSLNDGNYIIGRPYQYFGSPIFKTYNVRA